MMAGRGLTRRRFITHSGAGAARPLLGVNLGLPEMDPGLPGVDPGLPGLDPGLSGLDLMKIIVFRCFPMFLIDF